MNSAMGPNFKEKVFEYGTCRSREQHASQAVAKCSSFHFVSLSKKKKKKFT